MQTLWKWAKATIAVLLWAALFEILHIYGWFPEKWLADRVTDLMDTTPLAIQQPIIQWSLIVFFAAITLFAEHWVPPVIAAGWPKLKQLISRFKPQIVFGANNVDSGESYLPTPDIDLSMAVWLMSQRSAWAKWYRAQHLSSAILPIDERSFMNIVAHVVCDEAVNGNLAIRGRSYDSKDWDVIKREDWHSAYLDVQPNAGQLGAPWQVTIRPRSGIDAQLISKLIDYDNRLMVDSAKFQEIWPRRNASFDAPRKKLLKKAKSAGAGLAEIEKLSTP